MLLRVAFLSTSMSRLHMETRNARIGIVLFGIYVLLYGGFVMLNAYSPDSMAITPVAGINLAILYGFALIVAALILALLYGWLCKVPEGHGDGGEGQE
jgi:uncharacterized membrane protein (DUF485 family)